MISAGPAVAPGCGRHGGGSVPRAVWRRSKRIVMDTEETPMALLASALRSTTYEMADALEANESYQQRGWTDGLPIVAPTEESVLACLQAADLSPGDIVG